jgi:BirA family transcriptional regulator, biotin operon repressor / biotin---[acetyl-CoA-carboxylase] ligase
MPPHPMTEIASLGHPRLHLRRTDSTNERARALALAGAPHGTLVTAAEQTAGRGRQGRRWSAPAGSALLMSLLLRWPKRGCSSPEASVARLRSPALLPLAAAVAVCDLAGDGALVKWPNDVVVVRGEGLAKLAGILIEGRPQEGWAVLGIGVNVAVRVEQLPPELWDTAASLRAPPGAIEPALTRLLAALERRLGEPAGAILDAWRARDALRGREVSWSAGHGRAEGIDGDGRLVVRLPGGGQTALDAGEVHLAPGS